MRNARTVGLELALHDRGRLAVEDLLDEAAQVGPVGGRVAPVQVCDERDGGRCGSPISAARHHDTRTPATSSASTANPGTSARTPPKSLPQRGQPSTSTAITPVTTTTATAMRRWSLRSRLSATAVTNSSIPVANNENARLPKP